MSDMTPQSPSFTVRDLNRKTAKVLEAAEELGSVTIQARNGKRYVLQAAPPEQGGFEPPDFEARWSRLRELGFETPAPGEVERLDRIIAGEE